MKLSGSKLKKLLIFQKGTCKGLKIKKFLYYFSNISAKEKSFLYFSLKKQNFLN